MINAQMMPSMLPMVGGGPSLNLNDAASFDGVNDYLSRSSALIGAGSSKTYTLSFWVNFGTVTGTAQHEILSMLPDAGAATQIRAALQPGSNRFIVFMGPSSSAAYFITIPIGTFAANQWYHILLSFDLSSTSLRAVYINDSPVTPTYQNYSNDFISTNNMLPSIAASSVFYANRLLGRMCHLYFDNVYRDLSVLTNRRLFNSGSGPARGQAELSPIIYLPLVNNVPWGSNLGTGGDFTVHGDLA